MISIRGFVIASNAYAKQLLDENFEKSKIQIRNLKQIPITQIQNSKQLIHLQLYPAAGSPTGRGLAMQHNII